MKRATLALVISLGAAIAAACSATSSSSPPGKKDAGGSGGSSIGDGEDGDGSEDGDGGEGEGGNDDLDAGDDVTSDAGDLDASDYQPPLIGDGGTTVVDQSGQPGAKDKFDGTPNPGAKPRVIYPPDEVLLPPNMSTLEFHFVPAAGQTLFELAFHAPTTNLVIYFTCTPLNGGCVFTPDASFWNELVPYARGTDPVTYTLRGVDGSGQVGTSDAYTIAFSNQNIRGGIYYWNTDGLGRVQRYDWGAPNSPSETFINGAQAGGICVGCHAMSRDGEKMVVGRDIPSPAPYTVYNVITKQPTTAGSGPVTGAGNFFSFAPDTSSLLVSDGVKISWRSMVSGAVIQDPAVPLGTMPDWAPDGKNLVFAKPKTPPVLGIAQPGVSSASIELAAFTGTGFAASKTLVAANGQNNYYPAFAPTSDWIVFNRSPSDRNSFDNNSGSEAGAPDGELWAISVSGGQPVRLSNASDPGACSWPKWAPYRNDYFGGKVLWLTFSSDRAYGLRLSQGQRTQLWMVGFDPALAAQGKDPSLPAFWLPFQEIDGGNHIAQWVTHVARACKSDIECPVTYTCHAGKCKPK